MSDQALNAPTGTATAALPDNIVVKDGQAFIKTITYGKESLVPVAEAQVRLQKESAADQRMAEVAAERASLAAEKASHATAVRFYEKAVAGRNGDADAAAEVLRILGVEAEEAPTHTAPTRVNASPAPVDPHLQGFSILAQQCVDAGLDINQVLAGIVKKNVETERDEIYRVVEDSAKLDPILGPILKGKDSDAASVVRDELRDKARLMIGLDRAAANPSTYVAVVREISDRRKRGSTNKQTSLVPNANSHLGLGLAPGYGINAAEIGPNTEAPKPVAPRLAGYDKAAASLLTRKLIYDAQREATGDI